MSDNDRPRRFGIGFYIGTVIYIIACLGLLVAAGSQDSLFFVATVLLLPAGLVWWCGGGQIMFASICLTLLAISAPKTQFHRSSLLRSSRRPMQRSPLPAEVCRLATPMSAASPQSG